MTNTALQHVERTIALLKTAAAFTPSTPVSLDEEQKALLNRMQQDGLVANIYWNNVGQLANINITPAGITNMAQWSQHLDQNSKQANLLRFARDIAMLLIGALLTKWLS